jgi:hypothetical protein
MHPDRIWLPILDVFKKNIILDDFYVCSSAVLFMSVVIIVGQRLYCIYSGTNCMICEDLTYFFSC